MTITKDNMYLMVRNCDTGIVHAKYTMLHHSLTECGHNWTEFPKITTVFGPAKDITCKNCLRALGLIPKSFRKPKETPMKVYEFGEHGCMDDPTWIRTNRNIRLTNAAGRTDKYLKEINIGKNAAGVDLVIT